MNSPPRSITPAFYQPKPVRVWIVIGLFCVYLLASFAIFFDTVDPVADFWDKPTIMADSDTYWVAAGIGASDFSEQAQGADALTNTFGPVVQAELLRNRFNVALCNCFILILCLWVMRSTPEFDRSMFLLLLMANPLLIPALITLNKEIFTLAGMIFFVRYLSAKRFRSLWLFLGLGISFLARWQQPLVMLIFVAFEFRFSPFRRSPRLALLTTLAGFTIAYGLVTRLVPSFFEALLAQAQAGHTIVVLDNIQAKFGLPVVLVPKILMNTMGRFTAPAYFFSLDGYWSEDFLNWRDQIFMVIHTGLTTFMLLFLFFTRRLPIKHGTVRLLFYYLMMTAVNPMVQPRYEYPAYVLLCLEASRYFRLGSSDAVDAPPAKPLKELRSVSIS